MWRSSEGRTRTQSCKGKAVSEERDKTTVEIIFFLGCMATAGGQEAWCSWTRRNPPSLTYQISVFDLILGACCTFPSPHPFPTNPAIPCWTHHYLNFWHCLFGFLTGWWTNSDSNCTGRKWILPNNTAPTGFFTLPKCYGTNWVTACFQTWWLANVPILRWSFVGSKPAQPKAGDKQIHTSP